MFATSVERESEPVRLLVDGWEDPIMSWLWFVALLLIVPVIGFVGLAVISTTAGQFVVAGVACAIATYWMTLSNNTHRMG